MLAENSCRACLLRAFQPDRCPCLGHLSADRQWASSVVSQTFSPMPAISDGPFSERLTRGAFSPDGQHIQRAHTPWLLQIPQRLLIERLIGVGNPRPFVQEGDTGAKHVAHILRKGLSVLRAVPILDGQAARLNLLEAKAM